MVIRCLFSGCTVHKEQNPRWGRCLYGAKRTKSRLGAVLVRWLFGADYSKRRTTDPSFKPIEYGIKS